MRRLAAILSALSALSAFSAYVLSVPVSAQQAAAPAPTPAFRSNVSVVVVDVVVRDRSGAIVRGLTADEFEVREDNRPQQIRSFDFEEVTTTARAAAPPPALLTDAALAAPATAAAATPAPPLRREDVAGRRLVVLLFDLSSVQPDELERAGQAAVDYVDHQMTGSDLVAVATIDTTLDVLTDFTADHQAVKQALAHFTAVDGVAFETPAAETAATDEAGGAAGGSAEYDVFNNDARLRAIKTLADALAPVEQKKAILYFSSGMARSGSDNQVELRTAISAAVRANVSLYPVDTRGLQAVVPGGDATRASSFGSGAFSGRSVRGQFDQLQASQETLQTLASDTGGKAFTDNNAFGEAFTQVIRDTSAYYLLGYSSTNDVRDGRFRRITVKVKRADLRVEHRNGYYAERDFAHTGRQDRERELQEQLASPVSSTDIPVFVSAGWFRLAADRYYVPLSVAIPGDAARSTAAGEVDVLGAVRDEQGRPVGRIRQTLKLAPEGGTKQVLYQSGLSLPPGRFSAKVVVRDNASGAVGSFETGVFVPDLRRAPVKVSSVTLSTQLRPVEGRQRSESPLVREGVEILPSLTHVVDRAQKMYFYYEVYEPESAAGGTSSLKTSLAFYRGTVKVFETPLVERSGLDAADRRAAIFQFEVPASGLQPGLYTCQVNIIDDVAGRFAFPRLALYIR
ncbi:MAG TPA: VWA domain-containing protein [Vicinamibacterales bacterium]|jgi:VWFA-related protein|nr:VWA domain-containing protein [Vicinamibacterales bacterium]